MNMNVYFGRTSLRVSRKEARKHGVQIPKLDVWGTMLAGKRHYVVRTTPFGNPAFTGVAFSAYEARAKAIDNLIAEAIEAMGKNPAEVMYADAVTP